MCVWSVRTSGAAEWRRMSDAQKAPWQKRATDASKQYAATKPTVVKPKRTVAKAKLCVAKPKAAAKLRAAKSKAKPKVTVAKAKVSKLAAKSTKSRVAGTKKPAKTIKSTRTRVAGTKKPAKTIKKIKVCSCTKERSVKFSTITVCNKLPTLGGVVLVYKGETRRMNWGNYSWSGPSEEPGSFQCGPG